MLPADNLADHPQHHHPFPRASGAERVSPLSHAWIARLRRLRHPRGREVEGLVLVEGPRTIESAIRGGAVPAALVVDPAWAAAHDELCRHWTQLASRELAWWSLPPDALRRIATTETAPGVLAAVPIPEPGIARGRTAGPLRDGLGLALRVNDPGNLGTILRAAWAAGVRAVWLVSGTVDPWNPKVVRAGAGAHWHLDWAWVRDASEAVVQAGVGPAAIWLADPHRGIAPWEAERFPAQLLVVGHETAGLPSGLPGVPVRIPMPGGAESLNVAQATALLLYELIRTRAGRP